MTETVHIILQIALASALAATSVAVAVWTARALLTPLPGDADTELCTLIRADGDGESLETLIRGLLWLRGSGSLRGNIVIADCGLTPSGRRLAEIITRDVPSLTVCAAAELSDILEERAWTRGKLTYK
jgi:hypothetical protein